MVLLTSHSFDYDFGSKTDLPGAKLADTAEEAALSHYLIAFAEDNRSLPIYVSQPEMSYALREGWDQAVNVPFTSLVRLTHPNNQECQTIPSGSVVKLYGEGEYTVLSGCYVYSTEMETPGCRLCVADTDSDGVDSAGKLKYDAQATVTVAEVYRYNSTTGALTFKIDG
jgi:hypothetical protein